MIVHFYQAFDTLKNSPARRNKYILISSISALLINLALWFFLYIYLNRILASNPEVTSIPLHYNVFLGIDLVASWWQAFFLPLIGLAIIIVNTLLAFMVYSKKSLASYFLTTTSLLVHVTLAVAGLLIVLINL